jgi:uncharacterized membrane protein
VNALFLATVVSAVCAALIGGVFYAVSVFIMRAPYVREWLIWNHVRAA